MASAAFFPIGLYSKHEVLIESKTRRIREDGPSLVIKPDQFQNLDSEPFPVSVAQDIKPGLI